MESIRHTFPEPSWPPPGSRAALHLEWSLVYRDITVVWEGVLDFWISLTGLTAFQALRIGILSRILVWPMIDLG